jgi:hypothetical protein
VTSTTRSEHAPTTTFNLTSPFQVSNGGSFSDLEIHHQASSDELKTILDELCRHVDHFKSSVATGLHIHGFLPSEALATMCLGDRITPSSVWTLI